MYKYYMKAFAQLSLYAFLFKHADTVFFSSIGYWIGCTKEEVVSF
jgi:hypothetical protein